MYICTLVTKMEFDCPNKVILEMELLSMTDKLSIKGINCHLVLDHQWITT